MNIVEILNSTDVKLDKETKININGISDNSREIKSGYLFICIRGQKTDGHRYISDAIANGATAVITDKDYDGEKVEGVIYFTSSDTRAVAAHAFNAWYGRPTEKLKVIGITGTNGKTSVSYMLRAICREALIDTGLIGTVGCYSKDKRLDIRPAREDANMTTPDPCELYKILSLMVEDGISLVIMEVSSHSLIQQKVAPIRFESAIFTNLTPEHLDFHKSMEDYLRAKKMLFQKTEAAIINADDDYANEIAGEAEAYGCKNVRLCSIKGKNADYSANSIKNLGTQGVEYVLTSVSAVFKVKSPIPGEFTISNTLLASAAAHQIGILPRNIQTALLNMPVVEGRFERVKLPVNANFTVFIDYAHTPDALRNLLVTVRGFCLPGQRIVLLFGCGGDRDKTKRPIMGKIASELCDFVIITSDNQRNEDPQDIISDIMRGYDYGGALFEVIPSRRDAIDFAIRNAISDDIILLVGKGHEQYEIVGDKKYPFSEKEIVSHLAEKYYG